MALVRKASSHPVSDLNYSGQRIDRAFQVSTISKDYKELVIHRDAPAMFTQVACFHFLDATKHFLLTYQFPEDQEVWITEIDSSDPDVVLGHFRVDSFLNLYHAAF